jgi:hypothetical protein
VCDFLSIGFALAAPALPAAGLPVPPAIAVRAPGLNLPGVPVQGVSLATPSLPPLGALSPQALAVRDPSLKLPGKPNLPGVPPLLALPGSLPGLPPVGLPALPIHPDIPCPLSH